MYTLGIPDRLRKRTLGYLKQNWIEFEVQPSMDGFFDLIFPEMNEEGFRDIVNKLRQQGVTIIGADEQLTEKKIMNLAKLLGEQFNGVEDDLTSQGFESDPIKDILTDLKNILVEWETKKYDTPEERYTEYFQDIEELVNQYETELSPDGQMSDEEAMDAIMHDAPDGLYEQKIRNKIRKEITKLINQ